ncbi:DUF3526 domain-containing protein [Rhodoflexus sp.]
MFLHISKYDWLSLRANRNFYLIMALMGGLVWFSLWAGAQRVGFQRETLEKIVAQQQADYEKYRKILSDISGGMHFDGGHFGDPTNPFYFGNRMGAQYAYLPPSPLAVVAAGQSDLMPYYYKLTLSKRQALFHSEELENPQILYNGHFDLSFVVIFLLPLLIIALSYQIVSAEREQGTMPLLLAENTSLRSITAYRYLFRYLLFHLGFTFFMLVGLLALNVPLSQNIERLWLLLAIVWAYGAFWFAVSFLVNSMGYQSGVNAAALVGVWLLLLVFVPALLSIWVNRAHPMPSRVELIAESRRIGDALAKDKDALQRFYEEHPELKPAQINPQDRTSAMLFSRLQVEMSMEKQREIFAQKAMERREMVNRYRLLSPGIAMMEALNQVAGTSETVYADFDRQVTAYHQQFRDYFAPMVFKQEKFGVAQLDVLPKFTYRPIDFTPFILGLFIDVGYLVALALIFAIVANSRMAKVEFVYN